ncbi:MAG: hypothetical protein FWC50_12840 [Planctomycetaceae bacterium]|nr:hypothetical protein [Planctomycetaceae bacterium]
MTRAFVPSVEKSCVALPMEGDDKALLLEVEKFGTDWEMEMGVYDGTESKTDG